MTALTYLKHLTSGRPYVEVYFFVFKLIVDLILGDHALLFMNNEGFNSTN